MGPSAPSDASEGALSWALAGRARRSGVWNHWFCRYFSIVGFVTSTLGLGREVRSLRSLSRSKSPALGGMRAFSGARTTAWLAVEPATDRVEVLALLTTARRARDLQIRVRGPFRALGH